MKKLRLVPLVLVVLCASIPGMGAESTPAREPRGMQAPGAAMVSRARETTGQVSIEVLKQAIDNGETIAVFGDYDVDGVTATALLYQHLKGMGATVKCMLPSREGDGYGLSKNAIQSMHNKGCTLIVTVDNGISAVEEADFAASLGMDLIITDHHLPPDTLPAHRQSI